MSNKNDDYTYLFIKKCIKFLLKNNRALILIFSIITLNTVLFITTLYSEYIYTGAHIFNFNSLAALLHTDFWTHIFNIIGLFFIFSFSIILTTFFKFTLTLLFIKKLQNKKITLLQSLYLPLTRINEIIRFSFIRVFGYPEYWSSIIDPIEQSKTIKQLLQKESLLEDEYPEYSNPYEMIFIPLLLETKLNSNKALQESKEIIQKNFGAIKKYNYSYNKFRFFVTFSIITIVFLIMNLILKFDVFITFASSIYLIVLFFHIFGNIKLTFNAIIYNYCISGKTEEFTHEELKKMFS